MGYPMTHTQALGMRSLNAQAGQALLKQYFGPEIDYQQVRAQRIRLMDAYVEDHPIGLKPGARELLQWLELHHSPRALATSSPRDRIEAYLGPQGLLYSFDVLVSGYEVPQGKPEPDIFLHAAHQLGLPAENCMVLEDSPAGILAACRAGCMPVMIPDQDQPDPDTLKRLYAKADSLLDIIRLMACKE